MQDTSLTGNKQDYNRRYYQENKFRWSKEYQHGGKKEKFKKMRFYFIMHDDDGNVVYKEKFPTLKDMSRKFPQLKPYVFSRIHNGYYKDGEYSKYKIEKIKEDQVPLLPKLPKEEDFLEVPDDVTF